ncbi:hypothetical protein VO56_02270 [Mycoplasmopsis gallinacea]|uniref:DNA-binding protein HU n=1 Tax=Mycoplasmopsis gallinacea TaxID=29556 RepID=A0A0D5ZK55_9BACT|nr:hypothetical protein VO56_02270 [Mycoplasmopsis gallinacea]
MKKEFVDTLSLKLELSKNKTREIYNKFIETLQEKLQEHNSVHLQGLGRIKVSHREMKKLFGKKTKPIKFSVATMKMSSSTKEALKAR